MYKYEFKQIFLKLLSLFKWEVLTHYITYHSKIFSDFLSSNFYYEVGYTYNYNYKANVQSSFFQSKENFNELSEVTIQVAYALDIISPCKHTLRVSLKLYIKKTVEVKLFKLYVFTDIVCEHVQSRSAIFGLFRLGGDFTNRVPYLCFQ